MSNLVSQVKRSFAIVKKDMLIFYLKGPVVIMGLLFPFFMFAAFLIGRNLSHAYLFVALISMTAFFTSTAVGPTIKSKFYPFWKTLKSINQGCFKVARRKEAVLLW